MVKINELLNKIETIGFEGDKSVEVTEIVNFEGEAFHDNSLLWCSDKNLDNLSIVNSGSIVLSIKAYQSLEENNQLNDKINYIIVENPRGSFKEILTRFFVPKIELGKIHPSASIHPSVEINKDEVRIDHNVVLEEGVKIGNNVVIGANTIIKKDTILKNNLVIGCNNTIGGVGFGYEKNKQDEFEFIPHIGNVVICDGVEIGNNTCIDRAVIGSTVIGENVKIDNLVHIAHGVKIGKNSLIIANSMIAGSVEIGENVWVSPSVSIIQKSVIEDNSLVGMGSVVIKNVEKGSIVAGVPAKKLTSKK